MQTSALCISAEKGRLDVVRYLVVQGADMEKDDKYGWTPLLNAAYFGWLEVVRYLLEQGANRDKATPHHGFSPLHLAVYNRGHLETAMLLMVYGADLNARNRYGQLPIDCARSEEIKQAIRDEPRRRLDEAPGKRATEQDRHPNAATSASANQEVRENGEAVNKKPRLEEEATEDEQEDEGKVAEEVEDSEPSCDERDE